jgi:hypothetical protein
VLEEYERFRNRVTDVYYGAANGKRKDMQRVHINKGARDSAVGSGADTRREVVGSNSQEVIEFLSHYLIIPAASGPGLTQPRTEISSRNLPWGG